MVVIIKHGIPKMSKTQVTVETTERTAVEVYSFVHTYDKSGKVTDTRVVDMSNGGARKWLLDHHWWAMTNGLMLGLVVATKDDHDRFQLERLAKRFNKVA